ncbi:MAG: hypothetical protein ABI673_09615 [Novosphingobium sp.]
MTKPWDKMETRIVFTGCDYPELVLMFDELPSVNDTLAINDFGLFKIVERGFTAGFKNQPLRFLIVSELEGQNRAPTARYDFLN